MDFRKPDGYKNINHSSTIFVNTNNAPINDHINDQKNTNPVTKVGPTDKIDKIESRTNKT